MREPKIFFFQACDSKWQMQDDGGEDGPQVGSSGRDISSTPSGDVEILEGQDQELVVGTGTHLGGVVSVGSCFVYDVLWIYGPGP
jgi:hypothetical protein